MLQVCVKYGVSLPCNHRVKVDQTNQVARQGMQAACRPTVFVIRQVLHRPRRVSLTLDLCLAVACTALCFVYPCSLQPQMRAPCRGLYLPAFCSMLCEGLVLLSAVGCLKGAA